MKQVWTALSDFYSGRPVLDWAVALVLTGVLALAGVGHIEEISEVAVAVSTLSGIFAATAVFACSAVVQSKSLIMRLARATFPRALMKTWVSIILALMTAATLPIVALYLAAEHARAAEVIVVAAIILNVVVIARVAWWVRYVANAEVDHLDEPHQTQVPDWMKD